MTNLSAPTTAATRGEIRALREPIRLAAALPRLLRPDDGDTRTVITVPGFGADDRSMAPIRSYLRRRGHTALGWEGGRNNGVVEEMWPRLVDRVRAVTYSGHDTVDLVGWSLGGVLARETARDLPHLVGAVVTFGAPIVGGPRYTRAAGAYGEQRITEIERLIQERQERPISVPVTAMYSKRDGVVAWRACIDPSENPVDHVEVSSTHLGMVLDPDVWSTIGAVVARRREHRSTRPAA